jgi:hypothetical protein
MRTCDSHGDSQTKPGPARLGGKERFAQTGQHGGRDAHPVVAHTQAHDTSATVDMHFQSRRLAGRLPGIVQQVAQGTDKGVSIAQQLARRDVALPAHLDALKQRLGR